MRMRALIGLKAVRTTTSQVTCFLLIVGKGMAENVFVKKEQKLSPSVSVSFSYFFPLREKCHESFSLR